MNICTDAKYQNRRTMSSSDRALIAAFKEISTMADRINLPKTIVDRANNLFKQVHDGKNLKGRSNDAKASACLYIACRQEGVPRTFKEICAVSKISKKEIGRCFKLTLKALATSVDLITTADFMSRFCANLGRFCEIKSRSNLSDCQIQTKMSNTRFDFSRSINFRFTEYGTTCCDSHSSKSCRNGHCARAITDFGSSRCYLYGFTSISGKA